MSRYSDVTYVLNCPFALGISIIKKANDQALDSKVWEMWLSLYPNMTKDNFISFTDYKNKLLHTKKEQSTDEMIAMVKMLNAAYGGKVVEA